MRKSKWVCGLGVAIAILLRCCTTLHPYSGQGKPPMFGDYEAQRHWMEITVNLPINNWYRNTTNNNLLYWGLDYPPLTAYHSFLCGKIAKLINPQYIQLDTSHGYESYNHKLFMRYTVLIADLLLYIPSVLLFFFWTKCNKGEIRPHFAPIIMLLYPGLILIDHGHFQYNCISLAFFVFAVSFLQRNYFVLSTVFFCLAVNYKQMELYHSIPFFVYLLSICVPRPGRSFSDCIIQLYKISSTVLIVFAVIWFPFLSKLEDVLDVLRRLFPIDRGIFEDKVANVWCCINLVLKLRGLDQSRLLNYSAVLTLAAVLPSATDLFLRPNVKKFLPALINSSLAFFLFSYQVHEKSILLVAIPVLLYLPQQPFVCFWLLIITTFSMTPLFIKDELMVAYFGLTIFFSGTYRLVQILQDTNKDFVETNASTWAYLLKGGYKSVESAVLKNKIAIVVNLTKFLFYGSMFGCSLISILMGFLQAPEKYPDLYAVLVSVYSCVHFLLFFLFFNIHQLLIPELDRNPTIKVKMH